MYLLGSLPSKELRNQTPIKERLYMNRHWFKPESAVWFPLERIGMWCTGRVATITTEGAVSIHYYDEFNQLQRKIFSDPSVLKPLHVDDDTTPVKPLQNLLHSKFFNTPELARYLIWGYRSHMRGSGDPATLDLKYPLHQDAIQPQVSDYFAFVGLSTWFIVPSGKKRFELALLELSPQHVCFFGSETYERSSAEAYHNLLSFLDQIP